MKRYKNGDPNWNWIILDVAYKVARLFTPGFMFPYPSTRIHLISTLFDGGSCVYPKSNPDKCAVVVIHFFQCKSILLIKAVQ